MTAPIRFLVACVFVLTACTTASLLAAETDVTAVYAATANGYQRERGPDGRFKPETYSFGEGGRWDGTVVDKSLDQLTFLQVAQMISEPLRRQNFIPSASAKETKLLILVFWGSTTGSEGGRFQQGHEGVFNAMRELRPFVQGGSALERGAINDAAEYSVGDAQKMVKESVVSDFAQALLMNQAANAQRDRNNAQNAVILGFWDDFKKAQALPTFSFGRSIIEELEANRYFVVLKAYDFQTLLKEKKKLMLWETRFSVRQRNNRFDAMLPIMTANASKYFGQNSGRLLREVIPVGRVEVGEARVVETKAAAPEDK